MKSSRCLMVMILVAIGCGGAPSEPIEALPPSETETASASAAKGSAAEPVSPAPLPATPEAVQPAAAVRAESLDFDRCRRMRVQPAWCRKSPGERIRVSDTARGEGR